MLGLGEKDSEIITVMDELKSFDCDILTIGQYLQPSRGHILLKEYIHPDKFKEYETIGLEKGFRYVSSGPFVRSSFNASLVMDWINGGDIPDSVRHYEFNEEMLYD
jgi:lipoic acid synthetase